MRDVNFLPAPFAWIDIPAGNVTLIPDDKDKNNSYLKKDIVFDVPAFTIAKYPLTNAQYAKFVEADGYNQRQCWIDDGWEQREANGWTEPRYWQDPQRKGANQPGLSWSEALDYPRFKGANQPVVGVSWYEALAYTRWLSSLIGENVTLPTDQQWQQAAQGNDGRSYPWGVWKDQSCNHSIRPNGSGDGSVTTPVDKYEGKGDSPFGVVDMAGNVFEWCLTAYDSGKNDFTKADLRVLRGGSWDSELPGDFRCDHRGRYAPHGRINTVGLRLVINGGS